MTATVAMRDHAKRPISRQRLFAYWCAPFCLVLRCPVKRASSSSIPSCEPCCEPVRCNKGSSPRAMMAPVLTYSELVGGRNMLRSMFRLIGIYCEQQSSDDGLGRARCCFRCLRQNKSSPGLTGPGSSWADNLTFLTSITDLS